MSETVVEEQVEFVAEYTELNGSHRCDANRKGTCRAQVLVRSIETNRELLFCKHHFDVNQAQLSEWGDVVIDQREDLVAKEEEIHA